MRKETGEATLISSETQSQALIGNRYMVLDKLGEGGMGAVYRVLDRLSGMQVALKRVTRVGEDIHLSLPVVAEAGDSFELALANEFQILARLRHPHIVSVLDFGFDASKRPYFTMDLLLRTQKITDAAQRPEERIALLTQLLEALAYLHQRGIIHRDLKPENVLVDEQRHVRVLDFGLALSAEYARRKEQVLRGTLAYMAPEVLQGKAAQIASDLYSFGLVAYNVFGGGYPFDDSSLQGLIKIILTEPPDLSRFESSIAQFLGRLLAKSPDDRYQSVDEVIQALCAATNTPPPQESLAIRDSYLQTASFVGREAELQRILGLMGAAQSGKGAICLIAGESGVGKSRLLNELRVRALVENILVLQGQAVADGSSPYQVWRGVIQWLCIVTELSELEMQVLKDVVPNISEILQREVANAAALSGQAAQERLISVVANIFRRQPTPMIVILEDLQWAGEESIRLLKELLRVVPEAQLLILGSYRYDETPHLADDLPGAEILRLNRLTTGEISELTRSILGTSEHEAQIVAFLQRETEGNAFFVIETLRALALQTGELRRISAAPMTGSIAPGGVLAVLQQRIDRVSPENRRLLHYAAIVGRELDLPLLASLAPEIDLQKWLVACADVAVLEAHESRWHFAHDKLREYLITQLMQTEDAMRQLHREVALAIETIYNEQEHYIPALAHHWARAQDTTKAPYYLEKAALQAAVATPTAVIDYIQKAIEFDAVSGNLNPMRQARRHSLLGNAYYALGDYRLAEHHLQTASYYLGAATTPQRNWQAALGVLREVGVQFLHRRMPSRYLAKRDSSEVDRSIYVALFNKQVVYSYQGNMLKLLHAALVALNTVETWQPSEVANPSMAYGALTLSTGLMGLHSLARYYRRLTNAVLPQAGVHQRVLSRAVLGMYASQCAAWDEARETITNVVNRFDEIGAFHSADESVSYLARVYAHTGEFDRALQLASSSYERAKQRNDRIIRLQLFLLVVLLLARRNRLTVDTFADSALLHDPSAAEATFSEPFDVNPLNRSFYHALRAFAHVAAGLDGEAFISLRESARIANEHKLERSVLYFELYATLSDVSHYLLDAQAFDAATRSEIASVFTSSVKQLTKYAKVFTFAQPRAALYAGYAQFRAARSGQAANHWSRALASAQALQMPYDAGLAHAALSRVVSAAPEVRSSHTREARRLFTQLGAAYDLAGLDTPNAE